MSSTKVWHVKYQIGATSRVASSAANPQTRKGATEMAKKIANDNGWKVWVEHGKTGERIFDSVGSVPSEFALKITKKINEEEAQKALAARIAGSTFRPVLWSDIYKVKNRELGWGIEEKMKGKRAYVPRAIDGQIHPFKTKAQAQLRCNELNALASTSGARA
jgi:hypothetical protein